MDSPPFCAPARVIIVAGKGGVGKTTVSAALACCAARAGLATLVVAVDRDSSLPPLFGQTEPLGNERRALVPPTEAGAGVWGRTVTPNHALLEYLDDHGLRRVSRRLLSTGTLDVVATAVPGIKDVLVLGKVKQLERAMAAGEAGAPDLIVVDAPAAGHAVTFLAAAHSLLDAAAAGPIRSQASDVIALLGDPTRAQVLLVTLPEETPVNEAVETAYRLEDQTGVALAPIVVNGVWPHLALPDDVDGALDGSGLDAAARHALAGAAAFRRHRQALQAAQVERLAAELPLAQVHLPYLFTTDLGPADICRLAAALGPQLSRSRWSTPV